MFSLVQSNRLLPRPIPEGSQSPICQDAGLSDAQPSDVSRWTPDAGLYSQTSTTGSSSGLRSSRVSAGIAARACCRESQTMSGSASICVVPGPAICRRTTYLSGKSVGLK